MNLKPLFDNIIVKPGKAEEQTKSGLVIPDTAQEKPKQGEIVAVGEGTWDKHGEKRMPVDVKVGDTVIYKEWGKTSVKVDGEEYFIMSQSDVLAVVQG